MISYPATSWLPKTLPALQRATLLGAGAGAIIGGITSTFGFPIVGTFFGAIEGAISGGSVGVANGFAIAGVAAITPSRWNIRLSCAAITSSCAAALVFLNVAPQWASSHTWGGLLFVLMCTVLAAAVAPFAAFGEQPLNPRPLAPQRSVAELFRRALAIGAIGGVGVGAVVGLAIGIMTYPPTCMAALIEGGILGEVSGILLALMVGCLMVCSKLLISKLRVRI